MAILVTGCAGFIGSHVAKALLARGEFVIGIDNLNAYYNPEWKQLHIQELQAFDRFVFYQGDITDVQFLQTVTSPEPIATCLHLAAQAGSHLSIEDPDLYVRVNVSGTTQILEFARNRGIPQFIFGSSSSVYGNQRTVPFSELDPANDPVNPYGATKKAGEMLCKTYAHLYGIQTTCLRFFSVYGPGGRPDMVPYIFTEALFKGEPIQLYGDGTTQQDYTYIDDVVSGVIAAIDHPASFSIYNLGNDKTVSLKDVISILERVSGITAIVQVASSLPGDVPIRYPDIAPAQTELGYSPQIEIEVGLKRFVDWYREYRWPLLYPQVS